MDGWMEEVELMLLVFFSLLGNSSRGLWAGEWWRPEDIWGDLARDHNFKVSCTITLTHLQTVIYLYTWFSPSFIGVLSCFFLFKGSLATWRRRSRTRLMDLSDSLSRCFFPDLSHSDHLRYFIVNLLKLLIYCYLHFISLHCVQGRYPSDFMEAWDTFNQKKSSENDRPGQWEPRLIHIMLVLMFIHAYIWSGLFEF